MKHELINEVVMWNILRDCTTFDKRLDTALYNEEVQELFEAIRARDLVEIVDAVADIYFVYYGSQFKASISGEYFSVEHPNIFMEITKELIIVNDYFEFFMEEIFENVIRANDRKPEQKDENGKIVKGPNFIKPDEDHLKTIEKFGARLREY